MAPWAISVAIGPGQTAFTRIRSGATISAGQSTVRPIIGGSGIYDLPGLEVRSLYALYPDFDIDVATEQAALDAAGASHLPVHALIESPAAVHRGEVLPVVGFYLQPAVGGLELGGRR